MPRVGSRKRPAPSTSPMTQQPTMAYAPNAQMNDSYLPWGQTRQTDSPSRYPDPSTKFTPNLYNDISQPAATSSPSNQLTLRPGTHQIVPGGAFSSVNNDSWPTFGEVGSSHGADGTWSNEVEDLEQKALLAKKDAQQNRKSIPPFVQKLSSFLDQDRNKDLIRWSESGDSFIVVDEDEFAKTLIPELYKHNNYASFVRQLNMYGFHKKVGLSDNSMRASEKKHKTPSEYYNPYFKRGRPNLLWLIGKPRNPHGKAGGKGGSRVKRESREGDLDDDADDAIDADSPVPPDHSAIENGQTLRNGRQPLMISQGGLPQEDLFTVQRELRQVRQQQQQIAETIGRIMRENEQLRSQAAAFQTWHDRHENSINAILTFLATIYHKSLQGNGAQDFAKMFAGSIPPNNQQQGNVVDVGDYGDHEETLPNNQLQRPYRRQPLLLGAPSPNSYKSQQGRITSASPAMSANSPQTRPRTRSFTAHAQDQAYNNFGQSSAQSRDIQELFEQNNPIRTSESPRTQMNDQSDGQIPEQDIMAMINSANANSNFRGTRMDFPTALTHLENSDGSSPLTQNQRSDVLRMIANGSTNNVDIGSSDIGNNALTSPTPPPMPDLSLLAAQNETLKQLFDTQSKQANKISQLSQMVQPLSPTGSIPGLNDMQSYGGASPLGMDHIFNTEDYFNDLGTGDMDFSQNGTGNMSDFDFGNAMGNSSGIDQDGFVPAGVGNLDDGTDTRIIETVNSSEAASPANTVIEQGQDGTGSPRKKRRRL